MKIQYFTLNEAINSLTTGLAVAKKTDDQGLAQVSANVKKKRIFFNSL